jgi:glucose-6-phosphate isomerase
MIETIYLGFLLGVNPFDQPNVESYKEETRKILQKNDTNYVKKNLLNQVLIIIEFQLLKLRALT